MSARLVVVCDEDIMGAREAFGLAGVDLLRLLPAKSINAAALADAQALIVRSTLTIDNALLGASPVTFVGTATIGTDHVDLACLSQRGIRFVSAQGSSAVPVAQFTWSCAVVLAEKCGRDLRQLTLGVVGCGAIGELVATTAEKLQIQVKRFDPPLAAQVGAKGFADEEELSSCDLVSLHVPLVRAGAHATLNLVNHDWLERLPRGALLLNTSRGDVIDEQALRAALLSQRLSGCALDVFQNEPQIAADTLHAATLLSPHLAGRSLEGMLANTAALSQPFAEHFGLESDFATKNLLPKSPQIAVTPATNPAAFLDYAWDLWSTTARMRASSGRPAKERAWFFRELRSPPHRRDLGPDVVTGELSPDLASFLAAMPI